MKVKYLFKCISPFLLRKYQHVSCFCLKKLVKDALFFFFPCYSDAGLSSNMDHQFNDKYSECTLPVADKGSFVIPIPKQERDIFECPKMSGKIWSQPSVFRRAACPKVESQPETAEERFSTPPIVAAGQKNNFVPQATSLALSENNPEEETDKVLPRTAAITEEQQDVEIAVEDSCIKDTKMDTGGNPERKKGPPVDYGEVRNRHHHRKRAAGKTCN